MGRVLDPANLSLTAYEYNMNSKGEGPSPCYKPRCPHLALYFRSGLGWCFHFLLSSFLQSELFLANVLTLLSWELRFNWITMPWCTMVTGSSVVKRVAGFLWRCDCLIKQMSLSVGPSLDELLAPHQCLQQHLGAASPNPPTDKRPHHRLIPHSVVPTVRHSLMSQNSQLQNVRGSQRNVKDQRLVQSRFLSSILCPLVYFRNSRSASMLWRPEW